MKSLLVKNIKYLATNDEKLGNIEDAYIYVEDNIIKQIGKSAEVDIIADEIIDGQNYLVTPGFVNTHHHFYQTMTRAVPGAQNQKLFDWLVRLYPIWGEMDSEAVYTSTLVAMAEMILSGCTTSSDHLYLFPNGSRLDDQISAAQEIGMRFHAVRGSMSLGRSQGGLPPDHVVQSEDEILNDCQRVIERFHDPSPFSMLRIVLAPCSPFSVTRDLLVESAKLARTYDNVYLHTHVAETEDEETFCKQKVGLRPARYMEDVGWVGNDVWWAHCVWVSQDEIQMMSETGTGVAHCPSSNMRLGSGIAPIREMLDANVNVGIAVDGSASNDSSHVITEARMAMLLQRVNKGADALTISETLKLATSGGASVLGRGDIIGKLSPGKAADFIGIPLDRLGIAGGAIHDPLAALFLCTIPQVDLSVINGRVIVKDGKILTIDLPRVLELHNRISAKIVGRHPIPEKYKLV